MSTPIEAQSLSGLTNLFANPPQYPRNPTHRVHEPLSLYIVRVPGSKDVFLTPLKPPTKVTISLEAIQHSLYYFHVPTPEDDVVKEVAEQERRSYESSRPSVAIARKPLPTAASNHPLPPIPQESPYQPYGLSRTHDDTEKSRSDPLRLDTGPDFSIHRKQFDPTPQLPSLFDATGDYAVSPTKSDSHAAYQLGTDYVHQPPQRHSPSPDFHASLSHDAALPKQSFSTPFDTARRTDSTFPPVTVIRRDPTSGSQWNIGTISLLHSTFTGSPLRPVHIELTAPGYSRFNKIDFSPVRRGSGASDATNVRRAVQSFLETPGSPMSADAPSHPFARTVDFRKIGVSDLRRTVYQRTNSSDSLGRSTDLSKPLHEKNVLAFDSPWNGACTFVNAIDGKTLRIKHTIQSPGSPTSDSSTVNVAELRFNLGWSTLSNVRQSRQKTDEPDKLPIEQLLESKKENFRKSFQHLRHKSREGFQRIKASSQSREREAYDYQDSTQSQFHDPLRDLSNIRTPTTNNLMASSHPHKDNHLSTPGPGYGTDHSSRTSANPTSSENSDDNEGRISLKLGRERAGGGYRGHSAKLGKLVIEDEGLKMCDLVVSAAMGVWWQHYGIE